MNRVFLLSLSIMGGTALAGNIEIGQKGKTFSQTEITIKAGEKVVFKNDDSVSHNVFSSHPDSKFNLKIQKPGSAKEQVFNKKGTYDIRCAIHPKMKLKVNVK